MKLIRYGPAGCEKPALVDETGAIRDLSSDVKDFDPETLAEGVEMLRDIDPRKLPLVDAQARLGPPVGKVGKLIAIGLNYREHAAEAGMEAPPEPVIFMKATSCIVGPNDDIVLPPGSEKTDWEVELGVVIGKRASYVSEAKALDHVLGFTIVHDVSERSFQLERGGTWDKGKGCDTFGPIGPWLVTPDEIDDCQDLDLWLDVNGNKRQRGNTRQMIASCGFLVSYVSRFMTLLPGDIIATGTPPGVGLGMNPPTFLKDGDVVTLGIAGLGEQSQRVRRSS